MNIRHRITSLIVLAFLAIFSIGGYSIYQSKSNASEVKSVTEGVVPSALASADMVSRIKDVQLAAMVLVSETDASLLPQLKEKLAAKQTALQQSVQVQEKQASDDKQRGLVVQVKESMTGYFEAIDTTAKFKLEGKAEMAAASLFGNVAQYQGELEVIIDTLRIEKNRTKDGAIEALNKNLSATTEATGAVTLLMIVVLSAFGTLLYRQITRPISRMQAEMSEIAESQDLTRRVPVDKKDEIGQSIIAFNSMIGKIEESAGLLRQKTIDIQTMLQNMPQGILTIVEGNKVHPEYSAYLETILETADIAGRDVMELVFKESNLGADALSQIEAVGGACIGEDLMNFEFNEHLLVGEIEKTMPDGCKKFLDLNWSPITDDAGNIVRLMLCVRDVTELRALAAEAGKQKVELEVIGEILAVTQEKFHEFIESAIRFIDENEVIIRQNPGHDPAAVSHLFRNMHTIKGNARTYGLRHLTDTLHHAEQTYDELRKPRPDIAWDQTSLLGELAAVKVAVERYARVNDVSLGRRGPGRRATVERFLMVDKEHIQATLRRLDAVNTGNIHELLAVRNTVRNVLRLLGTESIAKILDGVLSSVPSLAQELGKVPPMVEIEDNGYVLRSQIGATLKNVFTHLVRNSVDHGIESPEERQAANKPAAGTITLRLSVDGPMLCVGLKDDGRGLALAKILERAVAAGKAEADAKLSDESIADLVFLSGLSTAKSVSEVSGRGVGMDAAINFIRAEQGSIKIHFTDNAVGAPFRQFETVVYLPLRFAEHVEHPHGPDARLSQRMLLPVASDAIAAEKPSQAAA